MALTGGGAAQDGEARAKVGTPSPLDPRSAGWHLTPRAWRGSAVYRALRTAEARHVAELVLFDLPRFQEETHYFGGKPFVIRRGQLFAAEETIAEIAGTSRKVVRTGLRTLITAGLITREKVHPSGQCPHVITIRDYELSQTLPGSGANGTASDGPETGQRRARDRAPSKPQEPQGTAPTAGEAPAAAEPRPAHPRPAKRGEAEGEDIAAARALRAVAERVFQELRGAPYTLATQRAVIADRVAARGLLAAAAGDLEAIEGRWRDALVHEGFPRVDTLADLAQHWARFSPPPGAARKRVAGKRCVGVDNNGQPILEGTAA